MITSEKRRRHTVRDRGQVKTTVKGGPATCHKSQVTRYVHRIRSASKGQRIEELELLVVRLRSYRALDVGSPMLHVEFKK